ncbi:C2H2-type zinc finger protein [Streptomyces salinarius]|uniref:C2H2-type zinc finger protein n=1 Tax=Streptomyces salinarius TaxID=2762598 RepID=UPI002852DA16|nr:C2H2-type zinc finger protein [Streptomyces salinarius]
MSDEIHIEPAPSRRVAFARWGVAQTPKARTVGVATFAVLPRQFVDAPEEVLIGALVDGRRYVSPAEDEDNGTPPPGAELLGVATEAGFTGSAAAGGDSSGPDFAPLDDAPEDDGQDDEALPYACPLCPRSFTTERGRDTHRRQVHRED